MTAAVIFCPGPSLNGCSEPRDRFIRIGVNRAVERIECDWWVFGDAEAFAFTPRGRPRVFTPRHTADRLGSALHAVDPDPLLYDAIGSRYPLSGCTFSMMAAIILAGEHLKAQQVTIYGADWRGEEDFTGTAPPAGCQVERHSRRWERERYEFRRLAEWMAGEGVIVRRNVVGFE